MPLPNLRRLALLSPTAWLGALMGFGLLCASLGYWSMQLLAPPVTLAPAARSEPAIGGADLGLAAQLFGRRQADAPVTAPAVTANIQVSGIVAAGRLGSALLQVDGKPGRAYSVGEQINGEMRLRAVRPDHVLIDDRGRELKLPAPPTTQVAVLSAGPATPRPTPAAPAPPVGAGGAAMSAPQPVIAPPVPPGSLSAPSPAAPGATTMPQPPGLPISSPNNPGAPGAPGIGVAPPRAPALAPGVSVEPGR